ncbi:MAG: glutathione S-transferase family protein [Sphingomonadales bacterium]|nr:glutathione S-transferase family protein [Sphingomonadales bacterium]
MKFYDCQPAPSPRRVRMMIAEKGIAVDKIEVDLRNGEHLKDWFRRINPRSEVPVLELDDGTVITESVAIYRYLEEIQPEPALMGRTPKEKAVIAMWDHKVEIEGFFAVAEVLRNTAKGFAGRAITGPQSYAQIPELAERGRRRVTEFMQTLDARLAHSRYLGGDQFSVADISGVVVVDFAGWIKATIPDDCLHLKRWHEEVSARPSAKL